MSELVLRVVALNGVARTVDHLFTARSFDADELFTTVAATRPRTVSIAGDAFGEGLEPAAVTTAVREHLASYKVPRTVQIAPVPRAPNGKIMFEAARRLFSADGSL